MGVMREIGSKGERGKKRNVQQCFNHNVPYTGGEGTETGCERKKVSIGLRRSGVKVCQNARHRRQETGERGRRNEGTCGGRNNV